MALIGANKMFINTKRSDLSGFTLVELAVTMLIASLISSALYSVYVVQDRLNISQQAVVEMQQNIRAGLGLLSRDLRMVGFKNTSGTDTGFIENGNFSNGSATPLTEAVVSNASQIAFTADLDNDGAIDLTAEDNNNDGRIDMADMEQIAYRLNGTKLERYSTTSGAIEWQVVAEQIQNIEFRYLDKNGNVTSDFEKVITVEVSILAIARRPDQKFSNNTAYSSSSGTNWTAPGDHFRRRLSITAIRCRNMGI